MSTKTITQITRAVLHLSVSEAPSVEKVVVLSIRDQLFNCIVKSLKHVGKTLSGENIFMAEWDWQGTNEQYFLRYKDINNLVSDILDEHPRCWDYRKATIALMNAEPGIVHHVYRTYRGDKAWYVDHTAYWYARNNMMDLTTPTGKHIFDGITNLGPNPTQGLSSDLIESKRLASILINKLWRTKKDFNMQLDPEVARSEMIRAILYNPIIAMQSNNYVYAALKEHSGAWE